MGYWPKTRNDFGVATRSAGTISVTSTTFVDLDSSNLDVVLDATSGDWVELQMSGAWSSEAVTGFLTVATIVSAAVVSRVGGTNGVAAWFGDGSVVTRIGGGVLLQLVAGDISAGTVTLRPQVAIGSAGTKSFFAGTGTPFQFSAKNLGQQP